jgi:hypothetical protein
MPSVKDVTSSFVKVEPAKIIAPRLRFGVVGINHGHI